MTEILLVGSGAMALDYAKVLEALSTPFEVVGRGETSAELFRSRMGKLVHHGGVEKYLLQNGSTLPKAAIVAVGVECLESVVHALLSAGVRKILIEKPGAMTLMGLEKLAAVANRVAAEVYVAYNRRFYASVQKAKELIDEDGGVSSFQFEFTEWSHTIAPLQKGPGVKEHWFLANSTHVIDLAWYLGGLPESFSAIHQGSLLWHPASAVFSGAGQTKAGSLFSYHADWTGPGRWGLELITKRRRLILRPLEKLDFVQLGSVKIENYPLEDHLDREFKPGLYKQVEAFLGDSDPLCSLEEQLSATRNYYYPMAGYPIGF